MKSPVKNIIFDFGGVILDLDYLKTQQAFTDLGFANFQHLYSQAVQQDLFNRFETGAISETFFFDEIKRISGLSHVSKQDLVNAWNAMLMGFPAENLVWLKKLKEQYRLYLLSNTNQTHIHAFEKQIEKVCSVESFESVFEKVYYSCKIHLRKPDHSCFDFVLKDSGLDPAETIFIDDSIQHVEGALAAGIKAYWLEKNKKTIDLLKDLQLINM